MTNNFCIFDSDKNNIMDDATFQTKCKTGIESGSIADSKLHNKLFYQLSLVTKSYIDNLQSVLGEMYGSILGTDDKINILLGMALNNFNTINYNLTNYFISQGINIIKLLNYNMHYNSISYENYLKLISLITEGGYDDSTANQIYSINSSSKSNMSVEIEQILNYTKNDISSNSNNITLFDPLNIFTISGENVNNIIDFKISINANNLDGEGTIKEATIFDYNGDIQSLINGINNKIFIANTDWLFVNLNVSDIIESVSSNYENPDAGLISNGIIFKILTGADSFLSSFNDYTIKIYFKAKIYNSLL